MLFDNLCHGTLHFGRGTEELPLRDTNNAACTHQGHILPKGSLARQLLGTFIIAQLAVLLPSKTTDGLVVAMPKIAFHLRGHLDFAALVVQFCRGVTRTEHHAVSGHPAKDAPPETARIDKRGPPRAKRTLPALPLFRKKALSLEVLVELVFQKPCRSKFLSNSSFMST